MCEQAKTPYEYFLQTLPSDWERLEIHKLGTVVGGGTPSREVSSYWHGDIPWVTPGEVSSTETQTLHSTNEHISQAGLNGSGAKLLPAGSLMVTTRATLGARAINAVPMATNQGFKSIIFKTLDDGGYYFHLFERLKPELIRRASGTTFLEISGSEFRSIQVPNPPIPEKKLIAKILDTLDTATRETERLIDKLKAVKQGLLQDLLTRGIDASGQLRPPQSEEPQLYKKSPLGWIPSGWEVLRLDTVAIRGSGHTPSKGVLSYWNGGVKWVSLADSHRLDQIYIHETDKEISELGLANSSAVLHPEGTVILSRDAGVGKSAILGCNMAVSQHFMAWRCGEKLNNLFLYFYLQREKPKFEAIAIGSTIKTIGLPFFKSYEIALPPRREQDQAAAILMEAEQNLKAQDAELDKLRQQKIGLMYDLLGGRVRVTPLLGSLRKTAGPTEL
ncbi:TPA: restriction endonuclease subunit S [Pseudomonas putida]